MRKLEKLANPRVYTSLQEALSDIEFESLKRIFTVTKVGEREIGSAKEEQELELKLSRFLDWYRNEGFKKLKKNQYFLMQKHQAFIEMFCNAHRASQKGEKISGIIYLGNRGLLLGTKQENGFFNAEQIEQIKCGYQVRTTRRGGGIGMELILSDARGVLVIPKKREFYISNLYRKSG